MTARWPHRSLLQRSKTNQLGYNLFGGNMADLRYPTGEFRFSGEFTEEDRKHAIDVIENTPAKMRAAVKGLKEKQLDTTYRPDGWTVREVVHHVPDSHLNAY